MSQAATVSRLALRELWMSFRLFVLLAAYVVAGASVALVPAESLPAAMDRLALATGLAATVAAVLAAVSVAVERERGRTGWLVARSVRRGTVLTGWFATLAGAAAAGHLVATAIGWVAALGLAAQLDVLGYLVPVLAGLAASVAAVGLGVLVGMALAPAAAAFVTVTAALALALGVASGLLPAPLVPGVGAFTVMADYTGLDATLGPGLVAAGVSLAAAAALIVGARFALERADL